ncbi:MAG TPA: GNAT family N-acetyltransferase [Bellilinea sp.]|nr:GNAT family N-acetyltransferase [Bellilinea sp.]
MEIQIREFVPEDTVLAIELWKATEGIGLSAADEPGQIARYLMRNPGMSFTAWDGQKMIGAVLCGHDGRRGYLHHLAVRADYRGRGIGQALAERCHAAMRSEGIDKVHIFVFRENQAALAFWQRVHYQPRENLALLSRNLD